MSVRDELSVEELTAGKTDLPSETPVASAPPKNAEEDCPGDSPKKAEHKAGGKSPEEAGEKSAASCEEKLEEGFASAEPPQPNASVQDSALDPVELEESWRTEGPSEPLPVPAASSLSKPSGPETSEVETSGGGLPPVIPPSPGTIEEPAEEPGASMSLLEHLGELRIRLMRALIAAGVGFLICYNFSRLLYNYLALPLVRVMPADTKLIYLGLPDAFFVDLKIAFVAGCFLASPYIFYQIWAFIAPGLYAEEKRYVIPLAVCSALFFIAGAAFCYFGVFPVAFKFFLSYSTDNIMAMPSIDSYLSFTLKMLLAFGLIFEMPLFAFFLARMGLITAAQMRKVRKFAILVIFVVAAILTPPDVFSQMLMAVPMFALYEVSVFVAAAVGKDKKKASAQGAPKEDS